MAPNAPVDLAEFRDQDLRLVFNRALRGVGVAILVGLPVIWLAWGWRSMLMFAVGGAIAETGLLEWRQLMSAVLNRLAGPGTTPRPLGPVLFWFVVRILGAGGLLYVTLKSLDGKLAALLAGMALGLIALTVEALRLLKSWSA